jgi:hypothetical protein
MALAAPDPRAQEHILRQVRGKNHLAWLAVDRRQIRDCSRIRRGPPEGHKLLADQFDFTIVQAKALLRMSRVGASACQRCRHPLRS